VPFRIGREVGSARDLTAPEIKAILRRENELRLSSEIQDLFRNASNEPDGWIGVVEELQRRTARQFGLSEKVGLAAMRGAEDLLPGDLEVREISLYRKFNRWMDGALRVGDAPPDVPLYKFGGDLRRDPVATTLHAALPSLRAGPLVLFAGSYS